MLIIFSVRIAVVNSAGTENLVQLQLHSATTISELKVIVSISKGHSVMIPSLDVLYLTKNTSLYKVIYTIIHLHLDYFRRKLFIYMIHGTFEHLTIDVIVTYF